MYFLLIGLNWVGNINRSGPLASTAGLRTGPDTPTQQRWNKGSKRRSHNRGALCTSQRSVHRDVTQPYRDLLVYMPSYSKLEHRHTASLHHASNHNAVHTCPPSQSGCLQPNQRSSHLPTNTIRLPSTTTQFTPAHQHKQVASNHNAVHICPPSQTGCLQPQRSPHMPTITNWLPPTTTQFTSAHHHERVAFSSSIISHPSSLHLFGRQK